MVIRQVQASETDVQNLYLFVVNNPINFIDPTGLQCFHKCYKKCIDSNYGGSFDKALRLSFIGVVALAQEAYNGVVSLVAKEELKALQLRGAFTRGNIIKKQAAAAKASALAKRLVPMTKVLSALSGATSLISAGATGYVAGAAGYCTFKCRDYIF